MDLMNLVYRLFDIILGWSFNIDPMLGVFVVSLVMGLLSTIVYKYFTDQKKLKELNVRRKELSEELKKNSSNPAKVKELNAELMKMGFLDQYKYTWKAMLITLLPFFLIFAWLGIVLGYTPLAVGEEFSVSAGFLSDASGKVSLMSDIPVIGDAEKDIASSVTWKLKPETPGEFDLTFKYGESEKVKKVYIGIDVPNGYKSVDAFGNSILQKISIGQKQTRLWFGWGWFWWYLIFVMISSLVLRKYLKVN